MEFKLIDINQIQDDSELLEIIEANVKTATFYREEISKMKTASKVITSSPTPSSVCEVETPQTEESNTDDDRTDFEDEIEFYLSQLRELTKENLEERIAEVLPVRRHKDFKKIILRLKLESIRNIKELDEMISDCINSKELDDIEMYKQEILNEKRIIELLDRALTLPPQQQAETSAEENRLIFVSTTGGNIRVLDEIDHIPEEYYEGFQELFTSIKDGTFKNIRRFTNHGTIAGISEVKGFKIRVIFSRLDRNSYAIISAFIKKNQNDKAYNEALKSRIGDYRDIAESLKNNLDNEEFLQLQKQYEEELYRKLGNKNTSSKTLEKGGM